VSSIRAPHLALHEQARRGDDDRIGEHNVGSNGPEVGPRLDAIFPAIAEYAFLSDCENNCLISPTGAVEWLCLPRPHDPSVFGTILDRSAGSFRLGPTDTAVPASRRYLPGTNILESTWQTRTGWLVVQDFLAVGPWHRTTDRSSLHRRTPGDFDAQHVLVRYATCLYESLRQTECFWREWIGGGNFPDRPWRERLQRSALTLKGLTYCSTGALLAAATTSLPEYPGGARNWDYRYTWVRDASFTLWALHALGFDAEADDFLAFLADVIVPLGPSGNGQSAAKVPIGPEPSRFQVLYGVDGTRECPESELDHLSG
jgi:GH15 family glucan-1,4-alpha-glucosidase